MERVTSAANEMRRYSSIKRSKFTAMLGREGQKIAIGNMGGMQQVSAAQKGCISQAEIVRPKTMIGGCAIFLQLIQSGGRRAKRVGIGSACRYPHECIFHNRATRPLQGPAVASGPFVRCLVVDMSGIEQCDQNIDVQEINHGLSSRRRLTISIVTGAPFPFVGNRLKPLRFLTEPFGSRDFRTSSERTLPAVVSCASARPFMATSTSSSMSRVVLMK